MAQRDRLFSSIALESPSAGGIQSHGIQYPVFSTLFKRDARLYQELKNRKLYQSKDDITIPGPY